MSVFIRLAVVASQICEIRRTFELLTVQGHPRSSILVGGDVKHYSTINNQPSILVPSKPRV